MSNLLWKSLVVTPAVLGASILVSTSAIAAPSNAEAQVVNKQEFSLTQKPQVLAQVEDKGTQESTKVDVLDKVNNYSNEGSGNSQSQVTSVSQFSDVQPTDWAFQALQSLVERYGCIAGYPNGTYRGNRALTRYEFAAGLNACLDRVNELIATATADLVTKEDLATLQRLQEEFSAELATLRGRVDALEARTAELEANQFSTTTKLKGEAIFALTDAFGDNTGDANNAVFQNRVRLSLKTSFTGKDVLTTRLASGNAQGFDIRDENDNSVNTAEGTQTFNDVPNGGNNVDLDRLTYETPVGPAKVYLAAVGGRHSHYAAVNNPYFFDGTTDGGNGALTTFASENPIYRIGGGAGAALKLRVGKGGSILRPSSVTIGYLASEADSPSNNDPNNPSNGTGVFNGNYAALGQLNFNVGSRIALAATYVHGYHGTGSLLFDSGNDRALVGTAQANLVGVSDVTNTSSPYSSNSYGISAAIRPSDNFSISGFVSYTDITGFGSDDDSQVWSYGAGVALPDFGKKGNVLGVFAGAQPYRGESDGERPYSIEGFYKYQVNDNVSITPGVIFLTNPGQSDDAEDAVIGTLRTTFTF